MTHRARPRVHLLTGGPAWEERGALGKPGRAGGPSGFTKRQKAARKPLNRAMNQLAAAVNRRDWRAARTARAAAWDEVDKLNPDLTREERKKLWEYKQRILAGETQDRRSPRRQQNGSKAPEASTLRSGTASRTPSVWVRPPELDRLQEQRMAAAARMRAAAEEKREEKVARRVAAKAKAAGRTKRQPREVRVSTSVRTVPGGLPSLGKRH